MLYLVYGSDYKKALEKKNELLKVCRMKRPDAEFFVLERNNFSQSVLESLYSSQGLFEQKHVVVLDHLLSEKDISGDVITGVKGMAASESIFIVFESTILAKDLVTVKKHAEKIFDFGEEKIKKGKDNTSFEVADTYLSRDKKTAWILFQKAMRNGVAPEALHGAFFYKVKMALLSKRTGRYDWSSKNMTEKELDETMERLVKMYHDIRAEGGELSEEIEKFLLEK